MVEHFNENGAALNLSELWGGCYGFAKRRIYNPENPLEDVPMPGKAGANWHWDAFVTVTDSSAHEIMKMSIKKNIKNVLIE